MEFKVKSNEDKICVMSITLSLKSRLTLADLFRFVFFFFFSNLKHEEYLKCQEFSSCFIKFFLPIPKTEFQPLDEAKKQVMTWCQRLLPEFL